MEIVRYHQDESEDMTFKSNNILHVASIFYQIHEQTNNTDEENYLHCLRENQKFKPFQDEKEAYIMFALQLLKSYEELKKSAIQLDYLYATVFRFPEFRVFDIRSAAIHLGFFYDIVLSDPVVLEAIKITYNGLCSHGTRILKITELIAHLKQLLDAKLVFNRIWKQKLKTIYNAYCSLDEFDDLQIPSELSKNLNISNQLLKPTKSATVQNTPDPIEDDEQTKQKKRDKNRRKKQKKKLQKLLVNIKIKENDEEIKDDQNIEQFSKSTEAQLDNVDPAVNQISEEFLCTSCREVQETRLHKQKEENKLTFEKPKISECDCEKSEEPPSQKIEEPPKPILEPEPEILTEEEIMLNELVKKYKNTQKAPRLKPNISEKDLEFIKNLLMQKMKEV